MIKTIYATKKDMSQIWDKAGKRVSVTKLAVETNVVVGEKVVQVKADKSQADSWTDQRVVEIGYGDKKLKRMAKPQRARLEKMKLVTGVRRIEGVREITTGEPLALGQEINATDILHVGDLVKVQGTTKGRGFAGAVKRYGFHGGPKTHGQSDRWRATGSIGNRTTPGRVWLGKRMPGHYGLETKTVLGLVVAKISEDGKEIWLTGAVPGSFNSIVRLTVTGQSKRQFDLPAVNVTPTTEETVAEPATKEQVAETVAAPTEEKVSE